MRGAEDCRGLAHSRPGWADPPPRASDGWTAVPRKKDWVDCRGGTSVTFPQAPNSFPGAARGPLAAPQPRQPSATASGMCSSGLTGSVEGTGTSRSDVA